MKLCIECHWYGFPGWSEAKCQHPAFRSPVDGQESLTCLFVRFREDMCGLSASGWEKYK